jgi:hypothetical protein
MCMSFPYITDPTMTEAYVAWKIVFFGRDLSLQNFILEGDAMEIIHVF